MLVKHIYHSPLGDMSIIANKEGVIGIWFFEQTYFEQGISEKPIEGLTEAIDLVIDWLNDYFSGRNPSTNNLPLIIKGSSFQKKVWNALRRIPYGQSRTYGELAKQLGCQSPQAVGTAIGRNPFSIIIPCHRVLSSAGKLSGYAGGLDKKRWLLEHEKITFTP
ncbi:methylated-DNA--[protein]-cysteine S-methyltransferase [Streptococcus sp. CSL7508-lung]|uniref:Methylated-DNA--protein-cysteine methyltransferase n=2 Tax=Streptococcus zalophi TaxID=640031 RepID=A0A934PA54_9STRE|nr:methylated-DNA--[protein]-cysteine S-methyltransferase [Streptococcus zalophi]MBJ8349693.1 methylated-DNA--[protein]-cysteine S-methyltransferase [Streptococcus zalophi]MCR8967958.1 methylated-DNA--[protein]-cysteine S-methyltransferase [Streptococcus zalophi]